MKTKVSFVLAVSAGLVFTLVARAENFVGNPAALQSANEDMRTSESVSVAPAVAVDTIPVGTISSSKKSAEVSPKVRKGSSAQTGVAIRLHHEHIRHVKVSNTEANTALRRSASAVSRLEETNRPANRAVKTIPVVYMIGVAF